MERYLGRGTQTGSFTVVALDKNDREHCFLSKKAKNDAQTKNRLNYASILFVFFFYHKTDMESISKIWLTYFSFSSHKSCFYHVYIFDCMVGHVIWVVVTFVCFFWSSWRVPCICIFEITIKWVLFAMLLMY